VFGLTGHWQSDEEVISASYLSVRSWKNWNGAIDPELTFTQLES